MKKVLFILAFVYGLSASAQTKYYFAATGRDSTVCPITNPCKTDWNSLTWAALDSFLLNRGDTFPAIFKPPNNGTSAHPIVVGTYGNPALPNPLIYGGYRLSGYTNVGGNTWTASCPLCQNVTNLVSYNGNLQGMGRTPNSGYDTVAATGTTYITDPSLAGTSLGTGELVLRLNHYLETRNIISSQSGDTIRYTAKNGTATAGWGFFIQNNVNTLDTAGEWWFDSTTHLMHIVLPDTTVPVIVSVLDTLVVAQSRQYITFDHINFKWANDAAANLQTTTGVVFQNCKVTHCNTGFIGANVSSARIVSDSIGPLNDLAVQFASGVTNKIDSNYIHDVGMIPGMGVPVSAYEGLSLQIANSQMNWNKLFRIGYDGFAIKGNADTASHNFVDSVCNLLDDGAAFYWYENLGASDSNKRCIGNLILNGIGAPLGAVEGIAGETGAVGIYTDQSSTSIEIDSNTINNCSQADLYLHSSQNIGVKYNTFYNTNNTNWTQIQMGHDNATYDKLRGINIKNNIIGSSSTATQYTGVAIVLTAIDGQLDSVGVIDSNNYVTPTPTWWTGTSTGSTTLQNYAGWQSVTGTDGHSLFYPQQVSFFYNPSQTSSLVIPLPGAADYWLDLTGTQHFSYTLPVLQSALLTPKQIITPLGTISKKLIP